jgi:hypothetical protein
VKLLQSDLVYNGKTHAPIGPHQADSLFVSSGEVVSHLNAKSLNKILNILSNILLSLSFCLPLLEIMQLLLPQLLEVLRSHYLFSLLLMLNYNDKSLLIPFSSNSIIFKSSFGTAFDSSLKETARPRSISTG